MKIYRTLGEQILTFLLEREVLCEMSTFMIASEENETGGVTKFEGIQIQQTLNEVRLDFLTR